MFSRTMPRRFCTRETTRGRRTDTWQRQRSPSVGLMFSSWRALSECRRYSLLLREKSLSLVFLSCLHLPLFLSLLSYCSVLFFESRAGASHSEGRRPLSDPCLLDRQSAGAAHHPRRVLAGLSVLSFTPFHPIPFHSIISPCAFHLSSFQQHNGILSTHIVFVSVSLIFYPLRSVLLLI